MTLGMPHFLYITLLQVIAFFLAGITAVSTGIDMFVSTFIDIPVQREWNISSVEYGLSPSTTCVANIIGGFLYSFLIDSYGRVWPYALALVHLGLVGLASAFSPTFTVFLTLGNLASLALPAISSVLYTTLVEFLPIRNRGKIIISVLVVQAIGACITGGLAWWLIPTYTERGWRYLVIATAIPKFISAAYRLFIFPLQSPRFLIAKGRLKEARKVFEKMAWLNRKNLDEILPKDKNIVCTSDDKNIPVCSQFCRNVSGLFKAPYLAVTIPMSVINVTSVTAYYCSSVFLLQILKEFGTDPYFASFVGYLGQIPGILLMAIIVEWRGVGRINSLRFFTLITIISWLLFAFVRDQIATPVLTIFLYFGMVPQVSLINAYLSEIYPTAIRNTALVFINSIAAIAGIGTPYFSGYMTQVSIPWLYPVVWAGFYFVQFVVSLFLRRETLGQNLQDTATVT